MFIQWSLYPVGHLSRPIFLPFVTERSEGHTEIQTQKEMEKHTHRDRKGQREMQKETERNREGQIERNIKFKYSCTLSKCFVYSCVSMTKI